jgi:chromosome segregation ATPase
MVEVTAPSGELMQAIVPEGVKPGDEFEVDVDVGTEPQPEPELELDPEPEPKAAGQIVPSGPSLVQRMKESSCHNENEQISRTLVHRMKSIASTQEQARLISNAANAAVIEVTVELMVARTETAFAQDQVIRMRATAAEADERAMRAASQLQEQYTTFQYEKLEMTASFEHRLADAEEARLHYEERLATTLEELSASLELSEQRNKRVNDLEMELATSEDKVVGLRDELAQAVDASLAASRNKMAMVEEWKAQRASLKSELKDCNLCRDALVAENDGLRRRLRAEGKPGTPMRTPGKKLTLRKESEGRRTSVLRQTMGAEMSPETTPERPRWNRV